MGPVCTYSYVQCGSKKKQSSVEYRSAIRCNIFERNLYFFGKGVDIHEYTPIEAIVVVASAESSSSAKKACGVT